MRQRICFLALAALLLVSAVFLGAISVEAEGESLVGSAECIRVIKEFEGFTEYPYWDYQQYTVGYGSTCPDDKYTYYCENGITEEEAEQLLREELVDIEEELNWFMGKYGLTLLQNQFDALVSFSYNCGTGWMYGSGSFRAAVINGLTGNDFIYPITLWCNAGGSPLLALVNRRLCEANMYLNGEYASTPPENYGYIIYDGNGGTCSSRIQGYDINQPVALSSTATYNGYVFNGWFTARKEGTQVTVADASVQNTRLYAQWTPLPGTVLPDAPDGVEVTVTAGAVNLREGPGTTFLIIGTAYKDELYIITETVEAGGYTWGKYEYGWICLNYTNYEEVISQLPPETDDGEEDPPAALMGTVKVNSVLRIRSGPGTAYDAVGELTNGTRVQILDQVKVGSVTWGRIAEGWISMDYVVLDEVEQLPEEHVCAETICTQCGMINASPSETVCLTQSLSLQSLTVPAGVTLDLNGYVLTVQTLTSFGDVIDTGWGGLITDLLIMERNTALPVFDSRLGGYRFLSYTFKSLGCRRENDAALVGFALIFEDREGYRLLADSQQSKLAVRISLTWGQKEETFAFSQELLRKYATSQLRHPGLQAALKLTITGLETLQEETVLTAVANLAAADGAVSAGSASVQLTAS